MRAILFALLICGCAHPGARAPAAPAAPLPWYGDLHALAEEAAARRGVELTQSFAVTPLDDAAFAARYGELTARRARELTPGIEALLRVFHLAERTAPTVLATQEKEVRKEQLIAFYDFASHAMYVRQALPESLRALGPDFQLALLAHEVGHVLQDQRGAERLTAGLAEFDQLMALRALLEGDATLTATLVISRRKGWSPERGVERSRLTAKALTPEQLLEASGVSVKLSGAAPLVRELMVFPYFRGAQLLNDLFRAGGLDLVDAVLQKPPRASWAVESPQRWLDGDPGALAPGPSDPAQKSGVLGGVMLRVLLDGCHLDSGLLAPLYRGDRWAATPEVELAWSTRWNNEFVATAAEKTLGSLEACWRLPPDHFAVKRDGDIVAVVSAAAGPARDAALERALHPTIAKMGAPPFGRRLIPPVDPRVALRSVGPNSWSDRRWVSEPLGIEWQAPAPFEVVPNPGAVFSVKAPGVIVIAAFIDDNANARTRDQFVNSFMINFSQTAYRETPPGMSLSTKHAWSDVPPRAVAGFETHERYSFGGGKAQHDVRCRVFPLCGGSAGFYLVSISTSEEGALAAERWLDGLAIARVDPPLCRP